MKSTYGKSVTVEVDAGIAQVRFDRGVNRNAIDQDTLLALTGAARDLETSLDVHAVVLTGASDIFSAGIDLRDPAKWNEGDLDLLHRRDVAQRGARLCRIWESLPQITVAAIEGPIVGGAAALALACDWRVASREAFIYLPEVRVGLNMGWGAIPRLTRLIGAPRAKRAILLGERLGAELAQEWGLLDGVTAPGESAREAKALARQVLRTSPALLRMTKEAINACSTSLDHQSIYMDADQALVCRDSQEGQAARQRFVSD